MDGWLLFLLLLLLFFCLCVCVCCALMILLRLLLLALTDAGGDAATLLFVLPVAVRPVTKWRYIRQSRAALFCLGPVLMRVSWAVPWKQKVKPVYTMPTVNQIYNFAKHLFIDAQLSAECSIVCLVYIERLMKNSGLLLLSNNWRPVLICGLLLASKVRPVLLGVGCAIDCVLTFVPPSVVARSQ